MPTWGRVECLGLVGGGTDAVRGWERARRCLPHVESGILASFPMLPASLAVDVSASPGGVARRRSRLLSCSQRFCFVFHGHCHLPSERNPPHGVRFVLRFGGEPRSDAVVPTTSHRACGFPSMVPPGGPLLPPSRIRNRFAVVDRIRPHGGHGSDVGRREVDVPSRATSSTTRGALRRLLRFRYVET